jgi:hypothetical protein
VFGATPSVWNSFYSQYKQELIDVKKSSKNEEEAIEKLTEM